jgi:16S rRNA (cytosine967-C5)-methyltransferase
MNDMGEKVDNPRKIALEILDSHFKSGIPLKGLLSEIFQSKNLKSLDRRFIFNIVKGTVRYLLRADFIISSLSDRRISDISPGILNVLRMGIYQLQFMDRVPAYSVVDESVKLSRSRKNNAAGFVNAILRRASEIRDYDGYITGILKGQKVEEDKIISVIHSFPEWIIKYWEKYYGREKTIRICRHLNKVPGFYIRINKRRYEEKKKDPHVLKDNIRRHIIEGLKNIKAGPVELKAGEIGKLDRDFSMVFGPAVFRHLERDSTVFEEAAAISSAMGIENEKLYNDGIISVQDLSSQMAVKYFLEPEPGEKILDCCAAPGGKASFTSQLISNSGSILAVDKSDDKVRVLSENLKRTGCENVTPVTSDSSKPGFLKHIKGNYINYFDRIIIDAPCSALGTIAKNPEIKYNRSLQDIERLSGLATDMMSACHPYLKAGGRMLFYTCTISPLENGLAVRRFLESMAGNYKIAAFEDISGIKKEMEMEIMPYYLQSEGGYVCALEKVKRYQE